MNILVVNPNTTASMTHTVRASAQRAASPGTIIQAVNPADGPPSIEGYYDQVFAAAGLVGELKRYGEEADAVVVACFDDTGLDAARSMSKSPVVGIGEAAYHMASLVAGRFSVITTLRQSVPAIQHNVVRYGLSSRCSGVRASEVPVLELEIVGSAARRRIEDQIELALTQDGADAIVLGCAGMANLAAALSEKFGVPVLEGVSCAIKLCEALVGLGLSTSTQNGYERPRPKAYSGRFFEFSPGRHWDSE